ncbi:MAG: DUF2461 domain-containing protein [Ginsengibacter sp.]
MISSQTLTFLKKLKNNNNKIWFDENREKYIAVKNDFEIFISELLQKMILFDSDLKDLSAKDCIFRINRDIRFSKDKTPYKINRSASFNKGGKKSIHAGYYFHLQPEGNSFVGGGLWMPQPEELKKLRQEIDYCFPEFKNIIEAPAFVKHYRKLEEDEMRMLVNVPKGYDKENPAALFLRMKSFVATKSITDTEVLSSSLIKEVVLAFKALMPLVKFINRAFE